LASWQQIKDQDLAALNGKLRAAGLAELQVASPAPETGAPAHN
jgi:hypothetical protein